jgi:hypothetical protein
VRFVKVQCNKLKQQRIFHKNIEIFPEDLDNEITLVEVNISKDFKKRGSYLLLFQQMFFSSKNAMK